MSKPFDALPVPVSPPVEIVVPWTVTCAPDCARTASACTFVVVIEPPEIVVVPSLLVSTPYASEPVVRMVVSVSFIVPPVATPGEAEPL